MRKSDRFQMLRAIEARKWLSSQEYAQDLEVDRAKRDALTVAQGHSLKCGLLKCHPECPKLRANA